MKNLLYISTVLLALLMSCNNPNTALKRLVEADSMLFRGQVDSAQFTLDYIQPHDLKTTGDSAYYFLLKNQTLIRQYEPNIQMGEINYAINYYSTVERNEDKLATAYYYKGIVLYDAGDLKNGVEFLKNAEFIANSSSNAELCHKVYEALVIVNEEAGDYTKAVDYCMKSIEESKRAGRANWMAHTYNNLAVLYSSMQKQDSAKIYLDRSKSLLKHIKPKDRIFIMNNIGVFLIKTDRDEAKRYFQEVIKLSPVPEAYDNLASLYADEGNEEEALQLWHKALDTKDSNKKAAVMRSLFEYRKKKGEYKDAADVAAQLLLITDTLVAMHNGSDVKAIQAEFDGNKSRLEYEKKITWSIVAIVLLSLLAVIVILYFRIKTYRARAIMARDQMRIKSFEAQVAELERLGLDKEKEIEQINRRKEKLIDKHRDTLNRGYSLYTDATNGKSTVLWKKKDFENVLEYYRLVDTEYSEVIDQKYEGLSPKYKFFLMLEHIGKTDAEIMNIMGVAEVSLRSIRSRVKKQSAKRKEKV